MSPNQQPTIPEEEFDNQLETKLRAKSVMTNINNWILFFIYVAFFFFVLTLLVMSLCLTSERRCETYSIMHTIDPNSVETINGQSYIYYTCLYHRVLKKEQCKNTFDFNPSKSITLYSKDTRCDCDFRLNEDTVCSYKASYVRASISLAVITGLFLVLIAILIIVKTRYSYMYEKALDVVLKYRVYD